MDEEKAVKSLPDGVEEIINQVQSSNLVANALMSNKKFFDDFNSLLSDLNKIVTEKKEAGQKYSQISLF
jgi:hypothetical protein